MSRLSSDTLFHFTSSIHHLVAVMAEEFRPHYALEDFGFIWSLSEEAVPCALPMVCFCDIPLSQSVAHMGTYGSYAIGLTKEWGIRNGIAPVLYTHPRSPVAVALHDLLLVPDPPSTGGPPQRGKAPTDRATCLARLMAYVKPYEGPFLREGRLVPRVRFYDEREWRWVPPNIDSLETLERDQYLDFAKLKEANASLATVPPLSFNPSDVKFIIVAVEAEILPLIRQLRTIKAKYSDDDVSLLCSRIVSAEQIARDL